MLLQDMLTDLGYTLAGEAGRIDEALELAKKGQFDVAILDVNLNGEPISPVVEVLIKRGLPFVFATGYGQGGVPEPYRQHPDLAEAIRSRGAGAGDRSRCPSRALARRPLYPNRAASCVMNGSSVMSRRSGVTAMLLARDRLQIAAVLRRPAAARNAIQ